MLPERSHFVCLILIPNILNNSEFTWNTPFISELVAGIQQCYTEDILDRLNLPAKEKWLKEEDLRYHHLSLDRRVLIDSLLRGVVTSDQLPPLRSRVVRIYVASTATGRCSCWWKSQNNNYLATVATTPSGFFRCHFKTYLDRNHLQKYFVENVINHIPWNFLLRWQY